MTTVERVAAIVMLVPAAIWAGIIACFAVERVNLWSRMPTDQYVVDFRRSLRRVDPLQPILAIVSIAGSAVYATSTGGTASMFAWVGAALIVVVIVISLAVPERINAQFRRREEGEAPPNVEMLRERWRAFHLARVVPAVAALIALVLATTFAG
ncbi:DUF1772 domain-containing protein [Aeromicrobium sp.]|uniref:DUF1772 domain-containing protein n=1 Tax=Aeromicrobium sp. TaxID=1871063 RepID=UPI0030C17502